MKFSRHLLGNNRPKLMAAVIGSALSVAAGPVFAQHTLQPVNSTVNPQLAPANSVKTVSRGLLIPPSPDAPERSAQSLVALQPQTGLSLHATTADGRHNLTTVPVQQVQYANSSKEPGLLQRFGRAIKPQRLLEPPVDPGMDYPKQPRLPSGNRAGQTAQIPGPQQLPPVSMIPPTTPGSLDTVLPQTNSFGLPPVDQLHIPATVARTPAPVPAPLARTPEPANSKGMKFLPPAPEDSGPPKVPPAILPAHPIEAKTQTTVVQAPEVQTPQVNPFTIPPAAAPQAAMSPGVAQTQKPQSFVLPEEPGRDTTEGVARATSPRKLADVASNDPFANLFPDDVPASVAETQKQAAPVKTAEAAPAVKPYTGMKLDSSFSNEPVQKPVEAAPEMSPAFPGASPSGSQPAVTTELPKVTDPVPSKGRLKLEPVFPEGSEEELTLEPEESAETSKSNDQSSMNSVSVSTSKSFNPFAVEAPEVEQQTVEASASASGKIEDLALDLKVPDPQVIPMLQPQVREAESAKATKESALSESLSQKEIQAQLPELIPEKAETPEADSEQKFQKIAERSNLTGLKGFCPVRLRDDRELIDTKPEFEMNYQGKAYGFSSQAALDKFIAMPERYAPAAGSNDVIHLALTGEKQEGILDYAVWYKGRLYLFSSVETLETFVASPSSHIADLPTGA